MTLRQRTLLDEIGIFRSLLDYYEDRAFAPLSETHRRVDQYLAGAAAERLETLTLQLHAEHPCG